MKILVPVDGSDYTQRTLDYFARHAAAIGGGSALTLIFVSLPLPMRVEIGMAPEDVRAYYADEARQATAAAVERLDRLGWSYRVETRIGIPADEICREAEAGGYDLIVMGSHGRGAIGCLLLGSTSQRVLAGCRVPVLLIR